MRVSTTTKEPHSLYIGVVVAKFVTPPRTAVLKSRGGVTHSGETRLVRAVPLRRAAAGRSHRNAQLIFTPRTLAGQAGLEPARPAW